MPSAGDLVEVRIASLGGFCEGTVRCIDVDGVLTIDMATDHAADVNTVCVTETDVRPRPPSPPIDFVASLDGNVNVEARGVDGVWQPAKLIACKMLRNEGGARRCQCTVQFIRQRTEVVVDEASVRPLLEWQRDSWAPVPQIREDLAPSAEVSCVAVDGESVAVSAADDSPSAGAAGGAPPFVEPMLAHPVTPGELMEVTSFDEGLIGSWYEVKIVRLGTDPPEGGGPDDARSRGRIRDCAQLAGLLVVDGHFGSRQALVLYTAFPDNAHEVLPQPLASCVPSAAPRSGCCAHVTRVLQVLCLSCTLDGVRWWRGARSG